METKNYPLEIFDLRIQTIIVRAKIDEQRKVFKKLKQEIRDIQKLADSECPPAQKIGTANCSMQQSDFGNDNDSDWTDLDRTMIGNSMLDVTASVPYNQLDSSTHDPNEMRFFVGNLSSKTDESSLLKYFKKFGEISDLYLGRDADGISRRFGFITFSRFFSTSPRHHRYHHINGQLVNLDSANNRDVGGESDTLLISGNIGEVTDTELLEHFSQYGKIMKLTRKRDQQPSRFALIAFDSCEAVNKAVRDDHKLKNQLVDVRHSKHRGAELGNH